MEHNAIIQSTAAERWVGYTEYIAILIQFLAILTAIFTANRAVATTPIMINGIAMSIFYWGLILAFSGYFVFLLFLAPLVFQARGFGQIMGSYIVIFSVLLTFFGAFF